MPKPQGQPGRPTNEEKAGPTPVPVRLPIPEAPQTTTMQAMASMPAQAQMPPQGAQMGGAGESPEELLELLAILMQAGAIDDGTS